MMKAPFILSVDFARNYGHNWPEWVVPLISNPHLIAISQDELSVQAHRLWSDSPTGGNNSNSSAVFVPAGQHEVWCGPLGQARAALMLVNKGESIATISASFALAGSAFHHCDNVTVFDVFGQRTLGRW